MLKNNIREIAFIMMLTFTGLLLTARMLGWSEVDTTEANMLIQASVSLTLVGAGHYFTSSSGDNRKDGNYK